MAFPEAGLKPGIRAQSLWFQEKEDGRMAEAAKVNRVPSAVEWSRNASVIQRLIRTACLAAGIAILLLCGSSSLSAQSECLACHGDASMTDTNGHSIAVDGKVFGDSVHGSLKCNDCHTNIKQYPHPEQVAKVECKTCHADQASSLAGSVHADSKDHPCTSCHGSAHKIFAKTDSRSSVYPLNVPNTCGQCHGTDGMAKKHGLPSVYPKYVDSIHGFALSKEGLLVAANCQSCHGSHGILSHKDPKSPTFKANIPQTCGQCHAKINDDYMSGAHGKGIAKGDKKAPVCTDCHTAHEILQPTESEFRMQLTLSTFTLLHTLPALRGVNRIV